MDRVQEKYLMKRLDEIKDKKKEEIYKKIGNFKNKELLYLLDYMIKNKSKIKLKCKYDPKEIFDIVASYPKNEVYMLEHIFDLSGCNYYKDKAKLDNKIYEIDEISKKIKRNIVLKNDCNDIFKIIKEFEEMEI